MFCVKSICIYIGEMLANIRKLGKNPTVHYPRLRRKTREHTTFGVQEPIRKNLYDVIQENFDVADRVSLVLTYWNEENIFGLQII